VIALLVVYLLGFAVFLAVEVYWLGDMAVRGIRA